MCWLCMCVSVAEFIQRMVPSARPPAVYGVHTRKKLWQETKSDQTGHQLRGKILVEGKLGKMRMAHRQ